MLFNTLFFIFSSALSSTLAHNAPMSSYRAIGIVQQNQPMSSSFNASHNQIAPSSPMANQQLSKLIAHAGSPMSASAKGSTNGEHHPMRSTYKHVIHKGSPMKGGSFLRT
jgi:hypothetical protein